MQESLGFSNALKVVADYDIVRINGVDSKGKEAIYLIFYNLDPQQPRSFTIKFFRENKSSKPTNIEIKTLKWSDKPKEVYSNGNQITFPFSFPENFVVNGISMIMFRNQ
jgi:hypothetical protein